MGQQGLTKARGIRTVEGEGRLVGPKTVQVGDDTYTGQNVVSATGSYSRTLPGLELDAQRVMASEHALQLDHVPASAIVLGGCEFASAWTGFGAEVTIVEALPHLVRSRTRRTPSCSSGPSAAARSASSSASGSRRSSTPTPACGCTSSVATRSRPRCCSSPLAVARRRRTSGTRSRASPSSAASSSDEFLRTSVGGVYAVGDLISIGGAPHLPLAHVGFAEAIMVAKHIAGLPVVPIDYFGVPRIT